MRARRVRRVRSVALVAACLLSGCGGKAGTEPALTPRAVVHAVLDPARDEQVILVERTREGSAPTRVTLDASDPIVSAGGSPISGARVLLIGPGSDTLQAVEDTAGRAGGTGAGIYRLRSVVRANATTDAPAGRLRLVPGARYRLVVETPLGTVRGATTMPGFTVPLTRIVRRFNLDRDTLAIAIPREQVGAAAYVVGHAHPGFANSSRTTTMFHARVLHPALPADSAWTFAPERAAIWPGTTQRFMVVAVDANFRRYGVVGADPFGDDVAGNSLEGGVGLFGAVAPLVDASLALVADREHAIEGDWVPLGGASALPLALRLFESPRFPRQPGSAGLTLTGTARLAGVGELSAEGTLADGVLALTLRAGATAGTVRRYTGAFDGRALTLQPAGSTVRVQYRPGE